MPQPLSTVVPEAGMIIGQTGDRAVSRHPELATMFAEAISTWSSVEFELLKFYLNMFGGAESLVATAYLALTTSSAKLNVILAVGEKRMVPKHYKVLQAILSIVKSREKARNKLAHRVWGYSIELPDALLLADPAHLLALPATAKDVFVYKAADFKSIISDNEELASWIIDLGIMHQYRGDQQADRLYEELSEQPDIALKLSIQK
tara:strand:+ start:548 stop:1162 length:615 start_codon:yes stop_codon:yes gene_type:complete